MQLTRLSLLLASWRLIGREWRRTRRPKAFGITIHRGGRWMLLLGFLGLSSSSTFELSPMLRCHRAYLTRGGEAVWEAANCLSCRTYELSCTYIFVAGAVLHSDSCINWRRLQRSFFLTVWFASLLSFYGFLPGAFYVHITSLSLTICTSAPLSRPREIGNDMAVTPYLLEVARWAGLAFRDSRVRSSLHELSWKGNQLLTRLFPHCKTGWMKAGSYLSLFCYLTIVEGRSCFAVL